MYFLFSIICRILDYTVIPKSFYWILGSVLVEAFLTSMIWMDNFGHYCFEIKREFYTKHQPSQYSNKKRPTDFRIKFYLSCLGAISKALIFLDWSIWDAFFIPALFTFHPFFKHLCPKTFESLYKKASNNDSLPFHKFSATSSHKIDNEENFSIKSTFGYASIGLFLVFSNLAISLNNSKQSPIVLALGSFVHFSPFLKREITLKSQSLKEFLIAFAALNLGTIFASFSQRIMINLTFLLCLALLKAFANHFYSVQLALMFTGVGLSLLGGEVNASFILTNWSFLITLLASSIFLFIFLLSPTMTFIKNVNFFKDVNKFILFLFALQFIKMWEDVEYSSITLDEALHHFQANFKAMSLLITINGLGFAILTKITIYLTTEFDVEKALEKTNETDYTEYFSFLFLDETEGRTRDSFYIYAMRKTSDYVIVIVAILFNLNFIDHPWLRLLTNFALSLLYSKNHPPSQFITKLNVIVFATQLFTFVIFKDIFVFVLELSTSIFSFNILKAMMIVLKIRPHHYDVLRIGIFRGLIGTTVPEALSIWKILANGLAIFLIIVPLNLLGYYLKTEKYKKNKKKQQDMIEMILEIGAIFILWILFYLPLFDSVFFLCISSYLSF